MVSIQAKRGLTRLHSCSLHYLVLQAFQSGQQIGGRIVTNLLYADEIILLATSEAELQELVDCLDRVSHKYSLLIKVDKTKVMASDGIACRILIQNEQMEQVDTFPYLTALIMEDGERMTEFCTRLNGAGNRSITAENAEKSQDTDFNKDTTNESASVACSNVRLAVKAGQKECRNPSWRLWGERAEKDVAGFVDRKENKSVCS